MRIIDANTGQQVYQNVPFDNVDGRNVVLDVEEGVFSARALLNTKRGIQWVPLVVRRLHPAFMFEKVGFLPS